MEHQLMNRRLNTQGIAPLRKGFVYRVVRPNGRCSRRSFGSPIRAAEHAMNAYGCDTWLPLMGRGFTVQGFYSSAGGDAQ
jgi:hypothetical protein